MTTVYFAHGKESGPWGSKIRYLADLSRVVKCSPCKPYPVARVRSKTMAKRRK